MHAARLTALALGLLLIGAAPAKAEPRGKVYFLVNPQAPREQWERAVAGGVCHAELDDDDSGTRARGLVVPV